MKRAVAGFALALTLASAGVAMGDATPSAPIIADTVVVRFHAPETGGAARPRYVTARSLAFE
ncbi:MAG TPA: hypothetical protein VF316_20440, partial [Polyangiaceae bacterium]